MKRPGFWREIAIALAIAMTGAIGFHVAKVVLGTWLALRLLVLGAGAAFALATLAAAPTRVGRLAAVIGLVAIDLALVASDAPLWLWATSQTFALWLLRCAYFHRGALGALGDFVLASFALCAVWTALLQTGSVFLALWSFGLVQSLFVFVPNALTVRTPPAPSTRFDHAQRTAEAALRRLTHA